MRVHRHATVPLRAALLALSLLVAASCSSGGDESETGDACAAELTECVPGACAHLPSDPAHCGRCGNACAAGLACSLGACSATCAAGLTQCGGACVALATDARHCGGCNVACASGQSCSLGACVGGASGAAGTGGSGGANTGGTSGSGGASGSGDGYQVGTTCFPECASATSDPDADGYGFEMNRSCIVAGSPPSVGAARCAPPAPMPDPNVPPGDGFLLGGTCHPRCASDASDPDTSGVRDGWGYEMGRSCIVVGSAPAMQGTPCVPPGATTGDGYQVEDRCVSACAHPELADAQGYGYEAQETCIVTGSPAAMQAARCALTPRTLPTPGTGFQHGETCFPRCTANAQEVTAGGFGWDVNRTCIVPESTAAIQGLPCVPPPSDVTGECPRTLACPVAGGVTLQCGCTWVDGLAERKQEILNTAGASRYFLASAMMETANLRADYTLGDGKTSDAFNAGLAKQNWGMIRRCHPAWTGLTESQFMTSTAMNSSLALDVTVYNECRAMWPTNWWSGHRNGYNNLNTNTTDIQQFKAAMDWTDQMLADHLADDVRFWVAIQAI